MRIGFHIPFSGNLNKLKERVHVSRGNCFQIFARSLRGVNKNGESVKLQKVNNKKLQEFHDFIEEKKIKPILVHAPYSYNLAQDENEFEELILEDLEFCKKLRSPYYIIQPGYHKKLHPIMSVENIKNHLFELLEKTDWYGEILIKNMSGAGSEMASTLEEWNELISFHPQVKGILDFARMYSSGYGFTTKEDADIFYNEIEEKISWDKIKAVYINDTNRGCGARKNDKKVPPLGEGVIGEYGYEEILKYPRIKEKIWLIENQPKPTYYDKTIEFLMPFHK